MLKKEVSIKAEVIEKGSLVMRQFIGDAKAPSGERYEMCISLGQSSPIIELPTGELVSFSWNSLINAAAEAVEGKNKHTTAKDIADEIINFKTNKYSDYKSLVIQIEEMLRDLGYSVDI